MSAVDQREALTLQLVAIVGSAPEGWIEFRFRRQGNAGMGQLWQPAAAPWTAVDRVLDLAIVTDVYVGCCPRQERYGGRDSIDQGWVLWADIDGPAACDRLREFRPLPNIVIRSGGPDRLHAWWALSSSLPPRWLEHANRRLAHHLGADAASVDAARILRPAGTRSFKYDPPAPVECVHLRDGRLPTAVDVLADVPDLPAPPVRERITTYRIDATDPLRRIPAEEYVPALTGREIGRDGKVPCTWHGSGDERTPSLHVYEDGWYCFGCQAGGSIIDFASRLYGLEARGRQFHEIRRRLYRDLYARAQA